MLDFNLNSLREVGGMFKFGSGVLGKSAIAIGILMVAAVVAVFRLNSDTAIIVTIVIAGTIFFVWFFPVLRFVEKHPDAGLLDGAQWTNYQRFAASAKGYVPKPEEKEPSQLPGSPTALLSEAARVPDLEPEPKK